MDSNISCTKIYFTKKMFCSKNRCTVIKHLFHRNDFREICNLIFLSMALLLLLSMLLLPPLSAHQYWQWQYEYHYKREWLDPHYGGSQIRTTPRAVYFLGRSPLPTSFVMVCKISCIKILVPKMFCSRNRCTVKKLFFKQNDFREIWHLIIFWWHCFCWSHRYCHHYYQAHQSFANYNMSVTISVSDYNCECVCDNGTE